VFGHEHYAENLEDLACAGVPIHHPISGKTVGALDLTCWRVDAGPLLISLAKTTADQIRQALLIDGGLREVELLQEYLRSCRRNTGIVFAFNGDTVMLNGYAQQVLDAGDRSVLLNEAAEVLASPRRGPVLVDLPTGGTARMYCRPVRPDDTGAGGVVRVTLLHTDRGQQSLPAVPSRASLPGVVGSGPLWLRAVGLAENACEAHRWLVLGGEAGTGKATVARAAYQRAHPGRRLRVLDGAEPSWLPGLADDLAGGGGFVIRHADRLTARQLSALTETLRAADPVPPAPAAPDPAPFPTSVADPLAPPAAGPLAVVGPAVPSAGASGSGRSALVPVWVALTRTGTSRSRELADLLTMFPAAAELPPLRHHAADVGDLVPMFVARLVGDRLAFSPEATQLLLRYHWPGNIEQVWQVVKRVTQQRSSGWVLPDDLPPECRTVSRRLLSPLESMERDAIVASLFDAQGNKAKAAKALGMSRATIYRKVHEYGIVSP